MPIDITMPALSPTMEVGTLAKWLVKTGDKVAPGDLIAEIETDKATMEVEAIDEGTVAKILIAEGTEDVPVGQLIAVLVEDGESVDDAATPKAKAKTPPKAPTTPTVEPVTAPPATPSPKAAIPASNGKRIKASPLAKRLAAAKGVDLAGISGSGPNGRIVKADLDSAKPAAAAPKPAAAPAAAPAAPAAMPPADAPYEAVKLSNVRKITARRLTESKQSVPHIYMTLDVQLDKLLKLRGELNVSLESRGIKLSVNDLIIKAQALALQEVPKCNVQFAGTAVYEYSRVDISVAVALEGGLITPIIRDAANKRLSEIATEMKDLAARAREGKLKPDEYMGGTASISNLGMYGIKQFDAVINPPQAMILAVGAGEKRPFVIDGALSVATVMSVTGSFDHRAIDGAPAAEFMAAFKRLVENPLGMLA